MMNETMPEKVIKSSRAALIIQAAVALMDVVVVTLARDVNWKVTETIEWILCRNSPVNYKKNISSLSRK